MRHKYEPRTIEQKCYLQVLLPHLLPAASLLPLLKTALTLCLLSVCGYIHTGEDLPHLSKIGSIGFVTNGCAVRVLDKPLTPISMVSRCVLFAAIHGECFGVK